MGKTNNSTISLNGKNYDSHTGAAVGHSASRKPAKHVTAHAPAAPHTLMRRAVNKPDTSLKHRLKPNTPTDKLAALPLSQAAVKASSAKPDPKRLSHAKRIAKSPLIVHFTAIKPTAIEAVPRQLPNATDTTPKASPASMQSQQPNTTAQFLENAIKNAKSHEQHPKLTKKDHVKVASSIGAGVAMVFLLFGLVVMQNLPDYHLRDATAKAGFIVRLPENQPSGFSQAKISASAGVAAARFNSTSGLGSYTIIQKRSELDSQSLRDGFVKSRGADFRTIEAGGRTIYIYGDQNATWVNGGVWYIIQSDGSLSDSQISSLATSL